MSPSEGGGYRVLDAETRNVLRDYRLGDSDTNPSSHRLDEGASHQDVGTYLFFQGLTASGIVVEAHTASGLGYGVLPRAPVNAIQLVAEGLPSPDQTAPRISHLAGAANLAQISVTFSEALSPGPATSLANYHVSGGLEILAASLGLDPATVVLTTTPQIPHSAYTVTVSNVIDLAGNPIVPDSQLSFTAFFLDDGFVIREVWRDGSLRQYLETLLALPRFIANLPDEQGALSRLEAPTDVGDYYGQRLSGVLVPEVSGDYEFAIAGDDNCHLYLSPDASPAEKQLIAYHKGWTNPREWFKIPTQISPPIPLDAGQEYYIEALMVEELGGDNLAVGWRPAGGATFEVISGRLLRAYCNPDSARLEIIEEPADLTVAEGDQATFSVGVDASSPLSSAPTFRWQRDGVDLPGATLTAYTTPPLTAADSGANYACVVDIWGAPAKLTRQARVTVTSPPGPILRVAELVDVTTLAGSGGAGDTDGTGAGAMFNGPNGGCVDAVGNVYIADSGNHRIRRVSPEGMVTTVAGTGQPGFADGPVAQAQFNLPMGLCVDAQGNIYIADTGNSRIRKIDPTGMVTTLAGSGLPGWRDGPGQSAWFNFPNDLVVDRSGNLFVSEFNNHTVRRVTPTGEVSTWAGNPEPGYVDGPREEARFMAPAGIARDATGNLYVTEWDGHRVRRIGTDGLVTTLAGNGVPGYADGPGTEARFNQPDGIVVDTDGFVYVTENGNHVIRRISPPGLVETVAGTGESGFADGPGAQAQFAAPSGIGLAADGTLFVADYLGHRVRRLILIVPIPAAIVAQPIDQAAWVGEDVTVMVEAVGTPPVQYSWRKGAVEIAVTEFPSLVLTNVQVEDSGPYSVEVSNQWGRVNSREAILTVSSPIIYVTDPVWVETLAGSGAPGWADGVGVAAQFNHPNAAFVDSQGFIYITDVLGHRIRKVSAAGEVTPLAGTGVAGHADGPAAEAQFNQPIGFCADATGAIYVVEAANHCVRKISPDGLVSTLAGNLIPGYRNGSGPQAQFDFPHDVVVDAQRDLYVVEFNNHTVRKLTPDGMVSTWAGSRTAGYADGPREQARFIQPAGIAIDAAGNLFVAERGGQRIRKIGTEGLVTTVAGTGVPGYLDGPAHQAVFNEPDGIVVDAAGNLWITDARNYAIRRISAAGMVETIAGTGVPGDEDGPGSMARFRWPLGIGIAGQDSFAVADSGNHLVRLVTLLKPVDILEQPVDQGAWLAQDVAFRVRAEGTPPLSYTWIKDGVALTESLRVHGVNTAELAVQFVQPSDAGAYWVVVTNLAGARSSVAANLVVHEPEPEIAAWEFVAEGDIGECPAIGWDGTVYCTYEIPGENRGGVYALAEATGEHLWTFADAGPVRLAPAVAPDGTVYAASSDGWLYALDGATGTLKWRSSQGTSLASGPAVAEDGTVLAHFDTVLCAFEAQDGTRRWNFPLEGLGETAAVLAPNGTVYVGSAAAEHLHAVDATTGVGLWNSPTPWPMVPSASPALGPDGIVYLPSEHQRVYAIDSSDGTDVWQSDSGGAGLTSLIIAADGTLFVSSAYAEEGLGLQALDGLTGQLKWEFSDANRSGVFPPALADDGTLYAVMGSQILWLDAATGARKGAFAVGQPITTPPALGETGWVYVGSGSHLSAVTMQ